MSTKEDKTTFCRICFVESSGHNLIRPCYCRGSVGSVHRECIQKWLEVRKSNRCEICNCNLKVERQKKNIVHWLVECDCRQKHALRHDLCLFVYLTLLFLVNLYFGYKYFLVEPQFVLKDASILMLIGLMVVIYLTGIYAKTRAHVQKFLDWRETNNRVVFIDSATD